MRTSNKKFIYTAIAGALVLALGACGGNDDDDNVTPPPTTVTPPPTTEVPPPTTETPPPTEVVDTSFDTYYNVCRGTDSKCYNNWGAFATTPDRVLIYSRTAGPRHANLGTPMGPGMNPPMVENNVMQAGLKRMLEAAGIEVHWTEDVTQLASQINRYKTVIFASSNRDTLWNEAAANSNDAARTSLRNYMRRGGGFVGLHNAFGAEYNWSYYEGLLGNANFYNHGPNRDGTVQIVAQDPSTEGVSLSFPFKDEWYNLAPFPTNVKFLAKVDTSTLSQVGAPPHPGHADFHPVAWCQYYDGGRAWLSTLGHAAEHFTENSAAPGAQDFQKMVVQAVKSTMGLTDFCTSTPAAAATGN